MFDKNEFQKSLLEGCAWDKIGMSVSRVDESVEAEETEQAEEEVIEEGSEQETETETATHTCPLCESTLDEELSDDTLLEHAQQMFLVFEEVEQILAEESEEVEESDDDEE